MRGKQRFINDKLRVCVSIINFFFNRIYTVKLPNSSYAEERTLVFGRKSKTKRENEVNSNLKKYFLKYQC